MTSRCRSFSVIVAIFMGTLLASCGDNEASICESAEEFQQAVDQIRIEELGSTLGAEFWQELDVLLSEIAASDSGEVGVIAFQLREELKRFVKRLESLDYDLIATALDPETAQLFLTTAKDLLDFASMEIQTTIDEQCQ